MARLLCVVRGQVNGTGYRESHEQFCLEVESILGRQAPAGYAHYHPLVPPGDTNALAFHRAFAAETRAAFWRFLGEHPLNFASGYLGNIPSNIHTEYTAIGTQLPEYAEEIGGISSLIEKKGINYRVSILSLFGVIMLFRRRKYRAAAILVAIYVYFALLSGFAVWQTNRIFYPAQVATSILIAFPLLAAWEFLVIRIDRFRERLARQ